MNKKIIFFFGVIIAIGMLASCQKTLTGKEAVQALEIEGQTPDIASLQYVVTIRNKTSSNVKGKIRIICDIYPRTMGDTTILGEVNDVVEDFWSPNGSKTFSLPIKRNYPINSDLELHAHIEEP